MRQWQKWKDLRCIKEDKMTAKSKETYDTICKCQEVLYNQGVVDGEPCLFL